MLGKKVLTKQEIQDGVDLAFNIELIKDKQQFQGYLANFKTYSVKEEDLVEKSALLLYFIDENGKWWKSILKYMPYFYVQCNAEHLSEVQRFLEMKFEKHIAQISVVEKIDLEMINHLSGKMAKYLKLQFRTIHDLIEVRKTIKFRIDNYQKQNVIQFSLQDIIEGKKKQFNDMFEALEDIREFDVPYHTRVCIDLDIRAGKWYRVDHEYGYVSSISCIEEMHERPDPGIMSFDIETTKAPLKFPDPSVDSILMISLMHKGIAYLITNREVCGQEVKPFHYCPKHEFECDAVIFNEPNEKALLDKFYGLIDEFRPMILTSFNGDKFDIPFIRQRSSHHGISFEQKTGIYLQEEDEYYGRFMAHFDCYYWVVRDAYLPQGSWGLKAVTRNKLGYEPVEVEVEAMLPMAQCETQKFAEYSISDAVATYFLYKKQIHDFLFSLCTIIPCSGDEVLRKGSGTLCENLLMAEAYRVGIIFQNKKKESTEKFYNGHLLDSETYIGGKVECLRSGVFRSDIPTKFQFNKEAYQNLINDVDKTIEFYAEIEQHTRISEIQNVEEVRQELISKLTALRDVPNPDSYETFPVVYHLDVAAMYPNIILTNRLQPVAIVDSKICSGCLYNHPENDCKRCLQWVWRGDYFPLNRNEYESIKIVLEQEKMAKSHNAEVESSAVVKRAPEPAPGLKVGSYWQHSQALRASEQSQETFNKQLKERIKKYCQKSYKVAHKQQTESKINTVCMRENPFYIDTVRNFRDRRYKFKGLVKKFKNEYDEQKKKNSKEGMVAANEMMELYESQQLAHKIILNSFYGYVMRKGARWYSMEMAAMVTHIGANIISHAKKFVDMVGKPLELDTDGIWCLLPKGFPEAIPVQFKNGKRDKIIYPCTVLNALIYELYCNKQYQTLDAASRQYIKRTEMSIFFEIDGPYRAMIIPAAREEGKQLKKRYVVFTKEGKMQELKGFELKRRGELKLIKQFQSEIFQQFLKGTSLLECYQECAQVARKFLNILTSKGKDVSDAELLQLIQESKNLSKELSEYGEQKGLGIGTAKRMAEFLGPAIVQGKGLNCQYIISHKPIDGQINDRCLPIQILSAEPEVKRKYLRKWLKDPSIDENVDIREIIDWQYYIERISNTIQKIIVIPAAFQGVKGILPEVPYPDWLDKKIREEDDVFNQKKILKYFKVIDKKLQHVKITEQMIGAQSPAKAANLASTPQRKGSVNINKTRKMSTSDMIAEDADTGAPGPESAGRRGTDSAGKSVFSPEKAAMAIPKVVRPAVTQRVKNRFDMSGQFRSWLREQKQIWGQMREQIKQGRSQQMGTIRGMLQNKEHEILNSVWQILQVCPAEKLGVFRVWLFTEHGQMLSVQVRVPRVIYVNSQVEHKGTEFKLNNSKKLPREKKPQFLYEISLTEEEYHSKYDDFDYFLTNPSIEGVYEMNLPLQFKFITQIGNVAKLAKKSIPANVSYQKFVFDFDSLQGISDQDAPYLHAIDLQYIYICELRMLDNQVWGIFNTMDNLYHILFVHKNQYIEQKYTKLVKECLQATYEVNDDTKVKLAHFEQVRQAIGYIDIYLKEYKEEHHQPVLVIAQTHYDLQQLRGLGLKQSWEEFPVLVMHPVLIPQSSYSSVDWQVKGIRFMCEVYCEFPAQLHQLKNYCNYAQIPLCNFDDEDEINYISDVLYQRLLKQFNYISWFDEFNKHQKTIDNYLLIPSDFMKDEYLKSGLYYSYCVQIDIALLAMSTIALSEELKNLNKDASLLIESKRSTEQIESIDEESAAKSAFRHLQTMVLAWLKDVQDNKNEISDKCLANIHRWISSEENKFYDPYLNRMLKKLMKIMLAMFVQKVKDLGVDIIYANMNKLILNTGKHTLAEAQEHVNYIKQIIIQNALFQDLAITDSKYYSVLLLYDGYNYLGFEDNPEDDARPRETYEWNIASFLPKKVENLFSLITLGYAHHVYQNKRSLLNIAVDETWEQQLVTRCKEYINQRLCEKLYDYLPQLEQEQRQYRILLDKMRSQEEQALCEAESGQAGMDLEKTSKKKAADDDAVSSEGLVSQSESEFEDEEEADDSFIVQESSQIDEGPVQKQNRRRQERLIKKVDLNLQNWAPPEQLGARIEYSNYIVELINFLSEILGLHKDIQDELITMKRNCYKILKLSDFSELAQFRDPCIVLKLDNIICRNCFNVQDLDLFRDRWECDKCDTPFNDFYIQHKIIQFLNNNVVHYQLMDLYCKKCQMVKEEHLEKRCKCSGHYELKVNEFSNPLANQYQPAIQSLKRLALNKNYILLQDVLANLTHHAPHHQLP